MKQTAVEWLVKEFNLEPYSATVQFAKDNEQQQKDNLAIEFAQSIIEEKLSLELLSELLEIFKQKKQC
jgi:hypothetical protein